MITQQRIQDIILAYFPEDEYDDETLRMARLVAENVERETRHSISSRLYEVIDKISQAPSKENK